MSAAFPKKKLSQLLKAADAAHTAQKRGAILEEAMQLLLESIPGVKVAESNVKHVANTEEVDILCWNDCLPQSVSFLSTPFLTECKNWAGKVDGQQVVVFSNTLRGRCCRDGILVAANDITGAVGQLHEAHFQIAVAARDGRRILVLTRADIESFNSYRDVVQRLKDRILEISLRGTKMT